MINRRRFDVWCWRQKSPPIIRQRQLLVHWIRRYNAQNGHVRLPRVAWSAARGARSFLRLGLFQWPNKKRHAAVDGGHVVTRWHVAINSDRKHAATAKELVSEPHEETTAYFNNQKAIMLYSWAPEKHKQTQRTNRTLSTLGFSVEHHICMFPREHLTCTLVFNRQGQQIRD